MDILVDYHISLWFGSVSEYLIIFSVNIKMVIAFKRMYQRNSIIKLIGRPLFINIDDVGVEDVDDV